MTESLTQITRLIALVFFLTSMGGIGLGLTLGEFVAPLRKLRFVGVAVLANFVVAPLLAIGLARWFHLEEPIAHGLLLLGLAAGAPFLPKMVGLAKGDTALAVALMALTMITTTVFLPMALPLLIRGTEVDAFGIARFLVLMLLLPFFAGIFIKARRPALADRWRPVLERISSVAMLLMVALVLLIHWRGFLAILGSGAMAAGLLFSILTAATGWLLGGGNRDHRIVLALGTSVRNIPAALLVGAQNFPDPGVVVMILATTLAGTFLLTPLARWMGRR
jgi:bile acid:Na+ symporter, BASS family